MPAFSIRKKLLTLISAALLSSVLIIVIQLYLLHGTMIEDRRQLLRGQVETALSLVKSFAERASSGKLSETEAQLAARDAVRALRYSGSEYFFIHDYSESNPGLVLVHPNAKVEGQNLWEGKDANGTLYVQKMIANARQGGGFVDYQFPRLNADQPSPKLGFSAAYAPWKWSITTALYVDDIDEAFRAQAFHAVAGSFPLFFILVVVAWLLAGSITRPLTGLATTMRQLSGGATDVHVPGRERTDEIGGMARAVEVLREAAVAKQKLEDQADNERAAKEEERALRESNSLREAATVRSAVDTLGHGLSCLAQGDLDCRIDTPFAGDLDILRGNFNDALEKLRATMRGILQNSYAVHGGAEEIRSSADNLARRTEQQAASVEETAAALEQITITVRDSASRAEEVGSLVSQTRNGAQRSGEVVDRAVRAMNDIKRSSDEISNIISVIDDIAFQTNLLALNAGVEAARAGEAGKGFAVVAQEVRELAQRSANAAKEIKLLITASGGQVKEGVEFVNQAGAALQSIAKAVQDINGHVAAIVVASREQATGLQEINTAVSTMDQATQHNAAMVEEQTAASHTLANEAAELKSLVGAFKFDRDERELEDLPRQKSRLRWAS
ncbi:methyl-accepting chemotaxis protein [bacterium M00.F.Ca.ET.194.01.1.1]|nr:methyl-accepting chemotaxis protein [bacterium M00.F.Ca.ET.194.01.1.1]TGS52338.1 methyl-accepting chemotaxis protein [bacterium M00.F.Ca.ET.179.01.1.1]TGV44199.1 methyl-accepting chemotaxis protein [bacterium M00.F.Ca.ET.168.01.1.1]